MARNVFIDLGANTGDVSADYARKHPEAEIICIEPNRDLIPHIMHASEVVGRPFTIIWAAAWTRDGMIDLFMSGANAASTVVAGKVELGNWPAIDYGRPMTVPSLNFTAWLKRSFHPADDITLKMDIEGAEYELLESMIADRSLLLVRRLLCEWHANRFPGLAPGRHDRVRQWAGLMTELVDWH